MGDWYCSKSCRKERLWVWVCSACFLLSEVRRPKEKLLLGHSKMQGSWQMEMLNCFDIVAAEIIQLFLKN